MGYSDKLRGKIKRKNISEIFCSFRKKIELINSFRKLVNFRIKSFSEKHLMVPSDFFLFGYIKTSLAGRSFKSPQDLLYKENEIMSDILKKILLKLFNQYIKSYLVENILSKDTYIYIYIYLYIYIFII